jgi:hypothetical protein
MPRKKKPLVDVTVECPGCKSEIQVEVFRKRVDEPVKPEYEYITHTKLIGNLFNQDSAPLYSVKYIKIRTLCQEIKREAEEM